MPVETPLEWIPVEDYGLELSRDMLSVKANGQVRILACTAALDTFNQPLFMDAARAIKGRGAEITLFTGPVLIDRGDGFSGPEQLVQEGVLNLIQETSTINVNHLHIVDREEGEKMYLEDAQLPFTVVSRGGFRWNPEAFTEAGWQHEVEVFKNRFDSFVSLVNRTREQHPHEYQPIPIRMTVERLEELVRFSQETHTSLAHMTARAFLALPIAR